MIDVPVVLVGGAGLEGGEDLLAEDREVLTQQSAQETGAVGHWLRSLPARPPASGARLRWREAPRARLRSNDLAVSVDQDRLHKAEGLDRCCELLDVLDRVGAQDAVVGLEALCRDILNCELQVAVEGIHLLACRRDNNFAV